jgi:hypothetical protein
VAPSSVSTEVPTESVDSDIRVPRHPPPSLVPTGDSIAEGCSVGKARRLSLCDGGNDGVAVPVNLTSRHALGVAHKAKHWRHSQCRQDRVEYHAQAGKTAGDLAFGKCPRSCDAMAYDTQCEAACLRCPYA